jgi:hypothetical protein
MTPNSAQELLPLYPNEVPSMMWQAGDGLVFDGLRFQRIAPGMETYAMLNMMKKIGDASAPEEVERVAEAIWKTRPQSLNRSPSLVELITLKNEAAAAMHAAPSTHGFQVVNESEYVEVLIEPPSTYVLENTGDDIKQVAKGDVTIRVRNKAQAAINAMRQPTMSMEQAVEIAADECHGDFPDGNYHRDMTDTVRVVRSALLALASAGALNLKEDK